MAGDYTHITVIAGQYPAETQAEGIAIGEAVAKGHCNNCGFLNVCSTNDTFKPPIFAWCSRRKAEILKSWEGRENGKT